MMRRRAWIALLAVPMAAAARPAPVTVRGGVHDGYSRVVFVMPPHMACRSLRLGGLLVLTFPHAGQVPGLAAPPAGVLSVAGGSNQAALGLTADQQVHVWQIDRRVVIDVFGPGSAAAPQRSP